ncbi:hypothetical protein [Streptomyces sp. NPDC059708]|uniref:hypothetical protein n=1 Tax=Streptomyces sp. NPDC059708 TaxID=3346916 RepID=UPI0036920CBF
MTDDSMAARDMAGLQLLDATYRRWANSPPVRMNLDRRDAWTVLIVLQSVMGHPALDATPTGAAVEAWARQLQEAICDNAEIYAAADRGWRRGASGGPPEAADAEPDPADVRLMTDAYTRWSRMPQVSATADRRHVWTVLTALQLAVTHPGVGETPMGPVVEAVGRAIQENLCDDPELYALAAAGWDRAADVETGSL